MRQRRALDPYAAPKTEFRRDPCRRCSFAASSSSTGQADGLLACLDGAHSGVFESRLVAASDVELRWMGTGADRTVRPSAAIGNGWLNWTMPRLLADSRFGLKFGPIRSAVPRLWATQPGRRSSAGLCRAGRSNEPVLTLPLSPVGGTSTKGAHDGPSVPKGFPPSRTDRDIIDVWKGRVGHPLCSNVPARLRFAKAGLDQRTRRHS